MYLITFPNVNIKIKQFCSSNEYFSHVTEILTPFYLFQEILHLFLLQTATNLFSKKKINNTSSTKLQKIHFLMTVFRC